MEVLSSVQDRGRLELHRVQYLYHCLADSLQRIPVNMVQIGRASCRERVFRAV